MGLSGVDIYRISQNELNRTIPTTIHTNIANKVVNNSVETTLLTQTITLQPEDIKPGSQVTITMYGNITTDIGVTGTMKLKLGSTVVKSSVLTLPNSLVSMNARLEIQLRFTSTGVWMTGYTLTQTAIGSSTPFFRDMGNNAEVLIDTTTSKTLDITYQFSSSSNNLTIINCEILSIK